jgi:hypothetical protein
MTRQTGTYYDKHRDRLLKGSKLWYYKNRVRVLKEAKQRYSLIRNSSENEAKRALKEFHRISRQKFITRTYGSYSNMWRAQNLEYSRERDRNYQRHRQLTDPVYRKMKLDNSIRWQNAHREKVHKYQRDYYRRKRAEKVVET